MRELYDVAMDLYTNHAVVYYYILGIGAITGILIWETVPSIVRRAKDILDEIKVIKGLTKMK